MNKSIWSTDKIDLKTTRKNIETDILIIGGGIAGISCMLKLYETNYKVTLIDAGKIGGITTRNTTGKLNIIQGYNYSKIEKITNKKCAKQHLKSQQEAIQQLKQNIDKYKIKCDLTKNESYLFTNNEENIKKIIEEKQILEDGGIKCETIKDLPNNYPCLYGIKTNESYVFNPIKYINDIVNLCQDKINIYEYTRAIQICKKMDYFLIKTNKNKITAKKIIICTHYPILSNKLEFPFKLKIEKEYVIAGKTEKTYKANMICEDNDELTSIRYYDDYIIFGGKKSSLQKNMDNKQNMNELINKFKNHFNNKIKYTWYNFDLISNDNLPIIGKLDNENILVATAFNKWGMTNGILAGNIIYDIIENNENEYIELLNPSRNTNLKKIINDCNCCLNNIKGYLIGLKKQKNITYQNINGIEYATYKDEKNKEHTVINKCPHMGCKLMFNELDKTWDCPCHGSRFNIDGKVIKGPSNYSIKPKNRP